jgi:hypothetical protein
MAKADLDEMRRVANLMNGFDDPFATLLRAAVDELEAARRVIHQARRFVPDPDVIQWERREVDIRDALDAYDKAVGRGLNPTREEVREVLEPLLKDPPF